jgi:hypothetical protein
MKNVAADMQIQAGAHCLFASLRGMLVKGYGLHRSEAEIYVLCDAMNVEHHPLSRPLWVGRSGEEMLMHMASRGPVDLAYEFIKANGQGREELLNQIQIQLSNGLIVLLFVHSGSLTYHPIYLENPSRPHVICGDGWGGEHGTINVIDSFLLDYSGTAHTYHGPASYQELAQGLYGAAFMNGIRTKATDEKFHKMSFLGIVSESFIRFLQGNCSQDGSVRGLAAYYSLYNSLEAAESLIEASFTDVCKEVYYCLRIGSIMHQWLYLEQLVNEYPDAFVSGPNYWNEKLQAESILWKKHLLHLYKIGLRAQKQQLLPILTHGRELIGRQAYLVEELLEELSLNV